MPATKTIAAGLLVAFQLDKSAGVVDSPLALLALLALGERDRRRLFPSLVFCHFVTHQVAEILRNRAVMVFGELGEVYLSDLSMRIIRLFSFAADIEMSSIQCIYITYATVTALKA